MSTNETSQNAQLFRVSNMHNVSWNSDIPKASFTLTILVGDGTLGGPQMRDNILKCHNGNYWIEGKQQKSAKPWTDKSGKTHEWSAINSFHKSHMSQDLINQLTAFVTSLYREDGNYEDLNNPTQTTATTGGTTVANGANTATTVGATEQPVAVAK